MTELKKNGIVIHVDVDKPSMFKGAKAAIKWLGLGVCLCACAFITMGGNFGHKPASPVPVANKATSVPMPTAASVPTSLPIISAPIPAEPAVQVPEDKEVIFPTSYEYLAAVATGVTMTISGEGEVYLEAGTIVKMTGLKREGDSHLVEVVNGDKAGTVPVKTAEQCNLRNMSMSGMSLCDDWFSLSLR